MIMTATEQVYFKQRMKNIYMIAKRKQIKNELKKAI